MLTDNTPPGITDELARRILQAIADPGHFLKRGDDYTEPIPDWSARAVRLVLDEWLAGRTVEPTHALIRTRIGVGRSVVSLANSEADAIDLVNAARLASEQRDYIEIVPVESPAAESSKGGDPYPRYYRWGTSHFYRVDAPDRVLFRNDERNDWSGSGVETEAALLSSNTATFERYTPASPRGGEPR